MAEQPDGSYPRLNGTLLQGGKYAGTIVSLVGKVEMYDGHNIDLKTGDGVIAKIMCEPDSEVVQGSIYEFIGHNNEDGTLQVSNRILPGRSYLKMLLPRRCTDNRAFSHSSSL
jgi:hypothetical protein